MSLPSVHPGDAPGSSSTDAGLALDELRAAVHELFGAERRLRGRDQRKPPGSLTYAQLRAMMVLREGECTAGQIADSSLNNPASTTAMLDHLEAVGVVRRRRSNEDRRLCLVSLTEKGHRIVEQKLDASQSLWRERFAEVPDQDLHATAETMRAIAAMFDAL